MLPEKSRYGNGAALETAKLVFCCCEKHRRLWRYSILPGTGPVGSTLITQDCGQQKFPKNQRVNYFFALWIVFYPRQFQIR